MITVNILTDAIYSISFMRKQAYKTMKATDTTLMVQIYFQKWDVPYVNLNGK
jgi:hypothetical protein